MVGKKKLGRRRLRIHLVFAGLSSLCCVGLCYLGPLSAQQTTEAQQQSSRAQANLAAGKRTFERHCALCHGIDGKGGRGPNLNRAHLLHAPDDRALKTFISEGIPPEMPEAWFLDEADVNNVAAFVRSLGKLPPESLPGDASRGAALFTKTGCARCHIVAGQGVGLGPALTDIGERRSAAHIRQAIANPASSLPEGFLFVKAVTASGQVIEGVRLNEDTFSIQIKDARGAFHSFRKQELMDLEKLRGQTPMPSYTSILDAAALDDIVAYLASQRGSP